MIVKESHIHKFDTPVTERILLNGGRLRAIDILKQYKCKCGRRVTYDLERKVKD